MTRVKGITRRWLINTLGVIAAIVIVIVICLSFAIKVFFYNSIEQTISGRSTELINVFGSYTTESSTDFITMATEYVENFPDKELMELMVINSAGRVVITSTGFPPDESQPMPDYEMAKSSSGGVATWSGTLVSGEPVMALTRVITNSQGSYLGAVRYIVSLEMANQRVMAFVAIFITSGVVIILLVLFSGSFFIRSIVNPVKKMSITAKRIAQGDFNAKIDKLHDDEIGDLCDAINNMAQELGVAEKMKNDFISSVSHELRTPLTAIKGWAETMHLGGVSDKETFDKGMSVIIKEASRLTGIVEELLDFSRLQNGRMMLMMDKTDILAELDESIYMLKERASSEGKHLLYDEPDYVGPVLGDRNRLKQVFFNIIDNALKYTPADGVVAIEVSADQDNVKIKVTDNGVGISPEDLPRVKEKFYKANQTVRGSGIGLAVADEIISMHNGTLDIESSLGVGTTVTITLPLIKEKSSDSGNPQ